MSVKLCFCLAFVHWGSLLFPRAAVNISYFPCFYFSSVIIILIFFVIFLRTTGEIGVLWSALLVSCNSLGSSTVTCVCMG